MIFVPCQTYRLSTAHYKLGAKVHFFLHMRKRASRMNIKKALIDTNNLYIVYLYIMLYI